MHALTASELLAVWEEGGNRLPYEQALLLLSAACPEQSFDQLAGLSIGRRDGHLLTLREWTFGSKLACVAACPACSERLEISANVADVRATTSESDGQELHLTSDDYQVDFRPPCGIDLMEAGSGADSESLRMAVFRRCIVKARHNGRDVGADQLPGSVANAVMDRMLEHDPQADTQFSLVCPACSHRWQAMFDIVSFFWSEIHTWAWRTLREVHTLASVYGWREADILAMSPLRRRLYLNMMGV